MTGNERREMEPPVAKRHFSSFFPLRQCLSLFWLLSFPECGFMQVKHTQFSGLELQHACVCVFVFTDL